MNIKPLGKRILVEPVKSENKTPSGIILAGSTPEIIKNLGVVKAIGSLEEYPEIQPQCRIIFNELSAVKIADGENILFIVNSEDILGIVE